MALSPKQPRRPRASHGRRPEASDVLNVVAHELRSPLAALKGQAQLLHRRLARQEGRAEDADDLKKILFQIGRLEFELDVYLEAARLFDGRFELHREPGDLVALLRRLVEQQRAGSSNVPLALECVEDDIVGEWDRAKVNILLGVLIANATKYGLGHEIELRVSANSDTARVEVLDRGLGVPPAERRRIFQPYVTGANVENSGPGLGLYVAREIVRRHGGRIGVRSREGGGSAFWFELPRARGQAGDNRLASAHATGNLARAESDRA